MRYCDLIYKNHFQIMNSRMRIYHRYLGFFLAGIMAMYALSGTVLIFRETEFLKFDKEIERQLSVNLSTEEIGRSLRLKEFKVEKTEGEVVYFKQGTYNKTSGLAVYKAKQLPYILEKMTRLHKATTNQPLYFLNIFFGVSLLFFVVSAFWMFMPDTAVFRKGLYFTLGGLILTLILIFI
jgi:pilus assembly protein TadC